MATLSIKMKVIADEATRQQIYDAHVLFNEQVRRFEEFLLLVRCRDYYYTDKNGEEQYKSVGEARADLAAFLQQKGVNNIDACVEALGRLDSVICEKGSQAAGMLTKLYNAESTGGTNNIAKIVDPVPEWAEHFDRAKEAFSSAAWQKKADSWITSVQGQKAIAPTLQGSGRPSAFKLAFTTGKPWYGSFLKDQDKYRKDLQDGLSRMLFDLEKEKALPLVEIDSSLVKDYPVWVRLMLKTALENYASYLACDDKTRIEYEKAVKRLSKAEESIKTQFQAAFGELEVFLRENYIQTDRSPYLTHRMVRGIDIVKTAWKSCGNKEERIEVLNKMQADTIQSRKIGDVNFIRWLAEDIHLFLLDGACLEALTDYYDALRQKENKRICASYTAADPVSSKRYLFYENESGTNYKSYQMAVVDGKIQVEVPLLIKNKEEGFEEVRVNFQLAPNTQMEKLEILEKGQVAYINGKSILPKGATEKERESFMGKMGGADLRVETNNLGRMKNIFMSFTIKADNKYAPEWGKFSQNAMYHFGTAYSSKATKYEANIIGKHIRALGIDLGLKQYAACSVGDVLYEGMTNGKPEIRYERMFMLRMDGEKTDSSADAYRAEAMNELWELRTEIRYISFLKRVFNQDDEGRKKILSKSIEYYTKPDQKTVLEYCLNVDSHKLSDECLISEYDRLMTLMNRRMKEFRSSKLSAKQKRLYQPGKSFWSISYLEELRKVLLAWNSLGYHIDDENILQDKAYGITATHLLEHIQNVKDDRIKTGADMIIQAALGYVYDEAQTCWVQKYDPCNVIVFEDLSRYRFSTDRPAKENSKLMQWAHREIIGETKRQAEIWGIAVYDSTDAAYSSRYHYKTGTPGIRCDRLSKADFDDNGVLKSYVRDRLPEIFLKQADSLKAGCIVPAQIGSIFTTLDESGKLTYINADINAACNLLERFFNRHTHLISIRTVNTDGLLRMEFDSEEDKEVGKRIRGKYLYQYDTDKIMLTYSDVTGYFSVVKKQKDIPVPNVGKDKVYRLFRDPSGVIQPEDRWMGYTIFWEKVETAILEQLIKG